MELSFIQTFYCLLKILLCCLLFETKARTADGASLTEITLHKYLFNDYNKNIRPIKNKKDPINVSFSFEINQIREVNDRAQFVRLNTWVRQYWRDEYLQWNESSFDNIKSIKVPREQVWIPDIVLHNNAGDEYAGGTDLYRTEIIIASNGHVTWVSPATFSSTCKFNMRHFPFDQQTCRLTFSSWTGDIRTVNLIDLNQPMITNNYVNSSQWIIEDTKSTLQYKKYPCCPYPFVELEFSVTLHRKSLYYTFNVITPCIILVINILVGFFLPPDCGERVSLTITILLAVSVFLELVGNTLPRNSDSIPVLAIFYVLMMAESALSLLCTCIVLVIYHKSNDTNPKPIPKVIRKIFIDGIGKCLQIRRDNAKDNKIRYDNLNDPFAENEAMPKKSVSTMDAIRNFRIDPNYNLKAEVLREVQKIRALMLQKEISNEEEDLQEEWRYLAKVIDRLFFWLFLLLIGLTGCFVLLPSYVRNLHAH